jgi:hypothetical protein
VPPAGRSRIIDEKAKPEEHRNLLAVTQVLMDLVHYDAPLYAIFGGKEAMIDSPLLKERIDEKVAEGRQQDVLEFLEARFGLVPLEVVQRIKEVTSADHLSLLIKQAARCPDLEAFRQALGVLRQLWRGPDRSPGSIEFPQGRTNEDEAHLRSKLLRNERRPFLVFCCAIWPGRCHRLD